MNAPKNSPRPRKQRRGPRPESNSRRLVETFLVIGAILLIPLFFAVRSGAIPFGARSTATPQEPIAATDATPSPASPVTSAERPPACTFPLAQTTLRESASERYSFSEPKVIYTPTSNDAEIQILDWLPDNERVLIMRNARGSPQQAIELVTASTGERQSFAMREQTMMTMQPPAWNAAIQAVVYPVARVLSRVNGIPQYDFQVWVSSGDLQDPKMLANNLTQANVANHPDGQQIALLFR